MREKETVRLLKSQVEKKRLRREKIPGLRFHLFYRRGLPNQGMIYRLLQTEYQKYCSPYG